MKNKSLYFFLLLSIFILIISLIPVVIMTKITRADSGSPTHVHSRNSLYYESTSIEPTSLIGCDPVTGRNQEFTITWEDVGLATKYELLIYKGDKESIWADIMVDMSDANQIINSYYTFAAGQTFASFPLSASESNLGGRFVSPAQVMFECGHTYWWRVRVAGSAYESYVDSPYSDYGSFTIKAGLPANSPFLNSTLFVPPNGASEIPIKDISFSWSSLNETTEYIFQLAGDADITRILVDEKVSKSAYANTDDLEYSTIYYWRYMASKPVPSNWSPVFIFITESYPIASTLPATTPLPLVTPIPIWVWVLMGTSTILAIVILIFITTKRLP
jgi:hypothetical protein